MSLFVLFVILMLFRYFLFQPYPMANGSMSPTLNEGETLFISKQFSLDRGDLVVVRFVNGEEHVRRVVGLEGDRISVKGDGLYVNGLVSKGKNVHSQKERLKKQVSTTDIRSVVVPAGHVFLSSDGEHLYRDSRSWGSIPVRQVVGEVKSVIWPLTKIRGIE